MTWRVDDFTAALTSVAPGTVAAYRSDITGFIEWAERAGLDGPERVDRLTVRRYLAALTTRVKNLEDALAALQTALGPLNGLSGNLVSTLTGP